MIILFINATTFICGSHIETNKTVATSKKYQGFNVASVLLRFESRGMFWEIIAGKASYRFSTA